MDEIQGTKLPVGQLAALALVRTLDYYDGPRLQLWRSRTGQFYLAWWFDEDSIAQRWIYLPVSKPRLLDITSGVIPSRRAIDEPEDGYIYVVDADTTAGTIVNVVQTVSASLDQDALPFAEARYTFPLMPEVYGFAVNERGHMLVAHLTHHEEASDLVPVRTLSVFAGAIQRLLDAIGQALSGKPTSRGSIPAETLAKTRFNAFAAQPSSLSIYFQSAEGDDLLGESLVRTSLDSLLGLLEAGHEPDPLMGQLRKLGSRVSKNYGDLLGIIASSTDSATTGWADYLHARYREVRLSSNEASAIQAIVEQESVKEAEVLRIHGRLIMGSVRTLRFEIEDGSTGERLSGTVDDLVRSGLDAVRLGASCEAVLEPRIEVSVVTGDEKTMYVLRQISPRHS